MPCMTEIFHFIYPPHMIPTLVLMALDELQQLHIVRCSEGRMDSTVSSAAQPGSCPTMRELASVEITKFSKT